METKNQPVIQGLIVSYFGNSVAVEADDGQVFQCHLKRNQALPVVGDIVFIEGEGTNRIVTNIAPRRSVFARGDSRGMMKPLAANIDVIVIMLAPQPQFSEYLIDRYLVAAELLEISPMIVLNKIDLLDDAALKVATQQLAPYEGIGYPVILSSIFTRNGLKSLGEHLKGKQAVLIGPSGVGKSSVIAMLTQEAAIRVGEVTAKGAGKHTTTATRLYHLPTGGSLIDSPGVRDFNLWPITKQEILMGFRELSTYKGMCRFRDCQHLVEPGCAVINAAEHGKISKTRLLSYQTLIKQIQSK